MWPFLGRLLVVRPFMHMRTGRGGGVRSKKKKRGWTPKDSQDFQNNVACGIGRRTRFRIPAQGPLLCGTEDVCAQDGRVGRRGGKTRTSKILHTYRKDRAKQWLALLLGRRSPAGRGIHGEKPTGPHGVVVTDLQQQSASLAAGGEGGGRGGWRAAQTALVFSSSRFGEGGREC